MVNKQILYAKLDNLQRCTKRIEDRIPGELEVFLNNWDIQDIVSLNIQRSIQACVDAGSHILAEDQELTPNSMAQVFSFLSMKGVISNELAKNLKKAVGFRNILVHEYQTVDWETAYYSTLSGLRDFRRFAEELVEWTEKG